MVTLDRYYRTVAEIRGGADGPRRNLPKKVKRVAEVRMSQRQNTGGLLSVEADRSPYGWPVTILSYPGATDTPLHERDLNVYTDGSYACGQGMAGAWALTDGEAVLLSGSVYLGQDGDSGTAEIRAVTLGLLVMPSGCRLTIRTDLLMLADAIAAPGSPTNDDEMRRLLDAASRHVSVGGRWVKGHSVDRHNRLVHDLATNARRRQNASEPHITANLSIGRNQPLPLAADRAS